MIGHQNVTDRDTTSFFQKILFKTKKSKKKVFEYIIPLLLCNKKKLFRTFITFIKNFRIVQITAKNRKKGKKNRVVLLI